MVKHNNIVPNQHFHKDWQRYVRTWFDQPAKKAARRTHRLIKAKQIAPRPLKALRPIVRGQTNQYNCKVRAGRGFTLDEIAAAKINRHEARGLGVTVDHRRKNRNEEAFQLNVNRLKLYKSKLIVFPRNATSKRAKAGDATKEQRQAAQQQILSTIMPVSVVLPRLKARKATTEEQEAEVRTVLRTALTDGKRWGAREKRKKDKADDSAGKKPKPQADAGDDE